MIVQFELLSLKWNWIKVFTIRYVLFLCCIWIESAKLIFDKTYLSNPVFHWAMDTMTSGDVEYLRLKKALTHSKFSWLALNQTDVIVSKKVGDHYGNLKLRHCNTATTQLIIGCSYWTTGANFRIFSFVLHFFFFIFCLELLIVTGHALDFAISDLNIVDSVFFSWK